jgi:Transposase IS4
MNFWAYLRLEKTMSILQINDISYFWRKDMNTGHEDFKKTMSRDDFQHIRSNLVLRDPHAESSVDPLWHSRKLLEHFQKNICQIAVPIGTSALDEASVRTKARTTASFYLPSEPDKYAIQLYAVVGSTNTYVSSIVDSSAGNNTGESGAETFCQVHQEMRKPFNNTLGKSDIVNKDSPTALWILQMAYQTKMYPDPSGKRVFFTDNFHTCHTLAKELKGITDNEARVIRTEKFTNVDSTNRRLLSEAMSMMADTPRGSRCVVCA